MRRFLCLLFFCGVLFSGTSLLAQNIELTLRYNLNLSRFEVYARPDATISGFTWGPSQVSLVVPASISNSAFTITSVNGGAWQDNSRVYAPSADPAHDFHGVGSLGAITDLVSGQEVLLFYFNLPLNDCTPGLRLFINGSDPDSEAPGMLGGDFGNTIDNGLITDVYAGNYDNTGTESSPRDTISATICANATYTFGGQPLSTSGTYQDTLTASNGCDSIVTLNLTVLPVSRDTIDVSICETTSYTFGAQTLTVAGVYADTLVAANGCDSIITLNLSILPLARDSISVSICAGETYTFGSQTLSVAGIYSDTLLAVAANGCDSIITLELIVRPVSRDTINASICAGETYIFGSQTLSVAGTYVDTLIAANACDSIVVLNLIINPVFQDTLVVSINEGSTYTFGGEILDSTGTYVDSLSTLNGCDSIVVLELTVIPTTGILQLKVMLQGSLFNTPSPGLMRDDLRSGNYLPLNDPYTSSGNTKFSHFGAGAAASTTTTVLSTNAGTDDAIVDWVFVELRSAADAKVILETRAALLQRDGDVVSPVDGTSALRFMGLAGNSYFVAVKHRNHLGAMTAAPLTLTTAGTTVDFTTMADAAVFNNSGFDGVEMITVGSVKALWAGNANADNKVKYQGSSNDNATILSQVLTHPGNTGGVYNYNSGFGYYGGDINMDGKVKYQGTGSDANFIFFNVITAYSPNVGDLYNYDLFREQLPL